MPLWVCGCERWGQRIVPQLGDSERTFKIWFLEVQITMNTWYLCCDDVYLHELDILLNYLHWSWLENRHIRTSKFTKLKEVCTDFPGGPVVKNPPANAGDMGSIPSSGRFHMPWGNLSPCAATTEPVYYVSWSPSALGPMLYDKRSLYNEKPVLCN